jgi:hypothetical protein
VRARTDEVASRFAEAFHSAADRTAYRWVMILLSQRALASASAIRLALGEMPTHDHLDEELQTLRLELAQLRKRIQSDR